VAGVGVVAPRSLALVGTGLIGASVGLAAKAAGVGLVSAYDAEAEALAVAAERGAVDAPAASLAEALEGAELVVLAVPVIRLADALREVLATAPEGCTVTDVGSTKASVCAAAGGSDRFVGGHPVCGAETRGPEHARGELFRGATWFLTPLASTAPERYRLVHGFVGELGAVPVAVEPAAHDRLVALTSHFPHALANLLVNQAGSARIDGHDPLAAAGGSLRDMTRVAGANPRIWVDIFLENAQELRAAGGGHPPRPAQRRQRTEQLEAALEVGDAGFIARWVGDALGSRRRMLADAFDDPGALHRLRVHVPDRPGVLAGITQALGAERINIEDFELQHHSPERGGVVTLLVAGEGQANRAAALLERQGYSVVVAPALDE
jgi:prephenate dehydrogenase